MTLEHQIKEALKGIDKDGTYDGFGWWETSGGASFGAEKLEEVLNIINNQNNITMTTAEYAEIMSKIELINDHELVKDNQDLQQLVDDLSSKVTDLEEEHEEEE